MSGIMGGMLAMPGPLAATWMSIRSYEKASVRSTILAFFVFAYGANVLSYTAVSGFDAQTLKLAVFPDSSSGARHRGRLGDLAPSIRNAFFSKDSSECFDGYHRDAFYPASFDGGCETAFGCDPVR
ncbi:hypothetical protein QW131_31645 [Roseibium salinum]|nr:hypothetical protein [Roseibium salinum]